MIIVDEVGVRRQQGNDIIEQVTWDELEEVVIRTTSAGPFVEDFFFILHGHKGAVCAVPSEDASPELVKRLQALPGFDHEKLIQASASPEEAQYICWRKNAKGS